MTAIMSVREILMNFSIGIMNGKAWGSRRLCLIHWCTKVCHVVHCFGYIIIPEERKNVFLRTKTTGRYGGKELVELVWEENCKGV